MWCSTCGSGVWWWWWWWWWGFKGLQPPPPLMGCSEECKNGVPCGMWASSNPPFNKTWIHQHVANCCGDICESFHGICHIITGMKGTVRLKWSVFKCREACLTPRVAHVLSGRLHIAGHPDLVVM